MQPIDNMENNSEDLRWLNFFERQANGEIPYNPQSYFIDAPVQEGSSQPVQLVTPTEQQVEMAKSQLKRNLAKPKSRDQRKKIIKKKKPQKGGKKKATKGKKKQTTKKRKPQKGGKTQRKKTVKRKYKKRKF